MQLNSNQIQKILPHRYPMLLVDRVTECEPGKSIRGIKCISANEMQFCGHFPQQHVMPGVLMIEALAQLGAIALLSLPQYKGKLVFFGGIKNARFRRQVIPGDVLEMECELGQMHGPVGSGKAVARVNGEVAVTAELTFAVGDAPEE